MRKAILLCTLLLVLAAPAALAGGLHLRWTQCEGDGGVQNITFACNTNVGNRSLAASYTLDADMFDLLGHVLVLDIATASPTLAPWWELRGSAATRCRVLGTTQALTISAQIGESCPDAFQGSASMGIASFTIGVIAPNKARILSVCAVPSTSPVNLILADHPVGNATWGVARYTINNQKTVGSPSCSGCQTPACIVFNSCALNTVGGASDRLLTEPAGPGSSYVTWQGGGGTDCAAATPTRNSSWGAVKQLYR